MGDISIIARRLSERYVQYGWSGNGGYFSNVGLKLLAWYLEPENVDYLFEQGEVRNIGIPHGEPKNLLERMMPVGTAHWLGKTEREIFSRIAFIDYGYFYDSDNTWYYVIPGPLRIKMPLWLVHRNLDEERKEFKFCERVERMVIDEIFKKHYCRDVTFHTYLAEAGYDESRMETVYNGMISKQEPIELLWDHNVKILKYFDDWVLIRPDESGANVGEIVMKPKTEKHIETCYW